MFFSVLSDRTLTRLVYVKQNGPQTCSTGTTLPPDDDVASDGNWSTLPEQVECSDEEDDGASVVTADDSDDDIEALDANADNAEDELIVHNLHSDA